MIPFGDYELYVKDFGVGEPTVIIEQGLNCKTYAYHDLAERLSKITRVISYDHAGIGQSTPNSNPRTLPYYVKELKALIEYKHLKPPYILVGHSLGGHIIRYYAYLYPDEVAGLVLVDHPHEDWFQYIRTHLPKKNLEKFNNFWNPQTSDYNGVGLMELSEYESNCDSIRGKKIPSNIPVRMYTGTKWGGWAKYFGYRKEDMKVWAELQSSLLIGVKDAKQVISSRADHLFYISNPRKVVSGVKDLIELYRKNKKK
jgi:hypothetical protein